jgi:hypothetical protein
MSITLAQAKALRYGDTLHFTGDGPCRRTVGPRGGVRESVSRIRVTGKPRVWKRHPERVTVPVKWGLYYSFKLTERTLKNVHFSDNCPLFAVPDAPDLSS